MNQSQKYLTDKALASAKAFDTGNFSTLPKDMIFNFERPAEEKKKYEQITNASQSGTFALGDTGGMAHANQLAGQYLKDKFARDMGQNFQNNVAGAAGNVQNMLLASSDAEANRIAFEDNRKLAILGAIDGLYKFKKQSNQGASNALWGGILAAAGGAASAAMGGGK